jgi:hypothetical protein
MVLYYHLQLPSSVFYPQDSIYFDVQYVEGEDRWSTSSNSVAALTQLNSETFPIWQSLACIGPETSLNKKCQGSAQPLVEFLRDTDLRYWPLLHIIAST